MTIVFDDGGLTPEEQAQFMADLENLTFGESVAAFRQCEDWTQAHAAQKLGITKQMLSAYERGVKYPSPKKAYEMAQVLGMHPEFTVTMLLNTQLKKAGINLVVRPA